MPNSFYHKDLTDAHRIKWHARRYSMLCKVHQSACSQFCFACLDRYSCGADRLAEIIIGALKKIKRHCEVLTT